MRVPAENRKCNYVHASCACFNVWMSLIQPIWTPYKIPFVALAVKPAVCSPTNIICAVRCNMLLPARGPVTLPLVVWPRCCRSWGFEEECGSSLFPFHSQIAPLLQTKHWLSSQEDPCCHQATYNKQPAPPGLITQHTAEWRVPLYWGLLYKTPPLRSKAWRNSWGVSCFDTVCMFF